VVCCLVVLHMPIIRRCAASRFWLYHMTCAVALGRFQQPCLAQWISRVIRVLSAFGGLPPHHVNEPPSIGANLNELIKTKGVLQRTAEELGWPSVTDSVAMV